MKLQYIIVVAVMLKYAEAACYNGSIASCNSCGGSCDTAQCFCIDGLTSCVPTEGECISERNACCPTGYFYDSTTPCCTDTPICNPSCSGDEICNNGTCLCNTTIYKGKTMEDLKPKVQCDSDIMTVSISRCLLTYLKYNYSTIHLADNSIACIPAVYSTIENKTKTDHIQAEMGAGWCGNIVKNDSQKIYITNTIHIDILHSAIITVNPLNFNFTCAYNLTMQLSLNYSVHPVMGIAMTDIRSDNLDISVTDNRACVGFENPSSTTNLPGINGTGSFPVTMAAYWDSQYANPIQDGEAITVGTDFFLGLFVKNADGNVFTLRAEKCVASPTDSSDPAGVNLVIGGCPAGGDISTTVEENGVSLETRIRVSSFKFQSADFVNIFCDVQLCDKRTDCTKCDNSASSRSYTNTREVGITLPYDDYNFSSSSVSHSALPWAVLCSTLLGFLSIRLY